MTDSDEERRSDVLDQASELELKRTQGLIAENAAKCKPQQVPREDGTFEITDCEDCGNEIGLGRLKVAIKNLYCVFCATKRERL